jgi:hypothetical protein
MPDTDLYARAVNARVRYEPLPPGESGYTVPKGESFVITVSSDESMERQRFTVCHEVAHIVLGLPTSHGEMPLWSYAKRHLNEVWCDVFASELLMPYEQFRKNIPPGEPSIQVIETLADAFGASFPATASRYASLVPFPCAYATMDMGTVRYAQANVELRRRGLRVLMRCPIPVGSVAHRLRVSGRNATDTNQVAQDTWLENCDLGYDLWELSRHYGEYDQTVSILWCTEDDLPRGEVDRFNRRIDEDDGLEDLTGEITWEKHGPRRG